MIETALKPKVTEWITPITDFLAQKGVAPNIITLIGLGMSLLAAAAFSLGRFRVAVFFVIFSGLCDLFDGAVARSSGQSSVFGAFLDSCLDRFSEIIIFLGICLYYLWAGEAIHIMLLFLTMAGSLMVSYTKARAEGLDHECKVGLMERPERIILLILGGLIGPAFFPIILLALVILTWLTVFQRMHHSWQLMENK
ncbi:MAG: CDP-alcohol phosphatidyltransferase family protein [bacterium]|nr:CDP-alcohol phosphatidyltransferase family protein [bacterium]